MPNIVQVLGPGRTGTTITHLMLANADDAFSCGEVYAYFRPWRSHHIKPICSCDRSFADCIWRKFDDIDESRFHAGISTKLNVDWVIDESKRLRWVMESQQWAKTNDMKIYNIVMMKDPINLIYSQWKRGKRIDQAAKTYVEYYGNFLDLGLPFISVKLEDLTRDPEIKLKRICDVIGMDYFKGKERFWEKRHCHLFGSLGLRKQMMRGDMDIRPEGEHQEKFLRLAQREVERFKTDRKLKKIQSALMEHEVDHIGDYSGVPYPVEKRIYPSWYYRDILLTQFRKYFPQQWEYSQ